MIYTVYAYWNAQQYYSVFNSIVGIMGGNDFNGLVKSVALIGLIVAAGAALVKLKGEEPFMWIVMLVLFNSALFVPKTTVSIYDVRTSYNYTVNNVPLGIAFFASTTSHIGYWLTTNFETAFTPVDDEKFAKNGLVFGSRLVETLQKIKMVNPGRINDITKFTDDCINPEIVNSPANLGNVMSSQDLWATYQNLVNPGRMTYLQLDGTSAGAYTCPGAWNLLQPQINNEVQERMGFLGRVLNPTDPSAAVTVVGQIQNIEQAMMGASRSAMDSIKQSMVLNAFVDSQASIAAMNNNPQATQISFAVATAEQSSATSYLAMAQVAQAALPKLRNAIELIILALFPVVFLLIVAAGSKAGMVLKSYVMALFWVQLWPPLYAVINFLALTSDKTGIMAQLAGSSVPTLANFRQVAEYTLGSQAITGMLTITIPVIALAIVKGGEVAMSGVASSVMAPAQGAAQRAGDAAGMGSFSGANISWGTANMHSSSIGMHSANKVDTSIGAVNPQQARVGDAYGNDTWMMGSGGRPFGPIISQTSNSSLGAFGLGSEQTAGRTNTWSSAQESALQAGFKSAINSSLNSAWSMLTQSGSRSQFESAYSKVVGNSDRGGTTNTWGDGMTTGSGYQNQTQVASGTTGTGSINLGANASAGGAVSSPSGANPKANLSGGKSNGGIESEVNALRANASAGFSGGFGIGKNNSASEGTGNVHGNSAQFQAQQSSQIAKVKENVDTVARTTSNSNVKFLAQQMSSELGKALQASQAAEQSYTRAERAGTGQQDSVGVGGSFRMDGGQLAMSNLQAAGFTPQEAREALVRSAAGESASSAQNPKVGQAMDILQGTHESMKAGTAGGPGGFAISSLKGPTSQGELDAKGPGQVQAANQENRAAVQSRPRGGGDGSLPTSSVARVSGGPGASTGSEGTLSGSGAKQPQGSAVAKPDSGSSQGGSQAPSPQRAANSTPRGSSPGSGAARGGSSGVSRPSSSAGGAPGVSGAGAGFGGALGGGAGGGGLGDELSQRRAAVDQKMNHGIGAINNGVYMDAGFAMISHAVRSNNMAQLGPTLNALRGNAPEVEKMARSLAASDPNFRMKVMGAGMSMARTGQVHADVQNDIVNDLAKADKGGIFTRQIMRPK